MSATAVAPGNRIRLIADSGKECRMTRKGNPSGNRGLNRPVVQDGTALCVCDGCGASFTRTMPRQRFCRPSCRWLGKPVQLLLFP